MNDEAFNPSTPSNSGMSSGTYRHQQLSALVPERVSLGVFSTGAIVLTTQTEFVIDFLIRMSRPHQVAARVVLPPGVIPQIIGALKQAIDRWTSHFGPIPTIPARTNNNDGQSKPSLQEVYEELKMPDAIMSGAYANSVMISFSAAEFSFDFITNFFPRSAVSQRVYLSVPQVPRLLEALEQTLVEFQRRIVNQQQQPPAPPAEPQEPSNPSDDELPDFPTDFPEEPRP
jgi:hypothetical protein